jgi:hypothetical protein
MHLDDALIFSQASLEYSESSVGTAFAFEVATVIERAGTAFAIQL